MNVSAGRTTDRLRDGALAGVAQVLAPAEVIALVDAVERLTNAARLVVDLADQLDGEPSVDIAEHLADAMDRAITGLAVAVDLVS